MARTDPQVNFRIPAELLERIKTAAAESNRTITAEVVSRLEASFENRGSLMDQDLVTKFRELVNPALIEMTRIENEARVALAKKGMTQNEIAEAMRAEVEDRSVVLKAAAQRMHTKRKAKS